MFPLPRDEFNLLGGEKLGLILPGEDGNVMMQGMLPFGFEHGFHFSGQPPLHPTHVVPHPGTSQNIFSLRIRACPHDRNYISVQPQYPGLSVYFTFNVHDYYRGTNGITPLSTAPPSTLRCGPEIYDFELPGDRYPRVFSGSEEVFPWTNFRDYIRGLVFYTFCGTGGYCTCNDGRPFRMYWNHLAVGNSDTTFDNMDPELDPFTRPSVIWSHLGKSNGNHLQILPEMIHLYSAGFRCRR